MILLLSIVLILFVGCSSTDIAGGATSESTNGIVVFTVADIAGEPVAGCTVHVHRISHLPTVNNSEKSTGIVTGPDGVVQLDSLPNDSLSIVIENDTLGYRVNLQSDGSSVDSLGTVTIQKSGTLTGSVSRDSLADTTHLFVQFQGTNKWIPVDSLGNFSTELPPGEWPLTVSSSSPQDGAISYDAVEVLPEQETSTGTLYLPVNSASQKHAVEYILSQNGIDTIPFEKIAVMDGAVIESLDLSGLNLTNILPMLGSCQIRALDLSNNNLTSFPDAVGWGIPQMERLDLSENKLTTIPHSLRTMKELEFLDLSSNSITSLPDDLAQLTPDTLLVGGNRLANPSEIIEAWLDLYAEDNWRELQN